MNIQLDKRFKDKAKGRFEKYEFEVGILQDGPHKEAKSKKTGFKSVAGVNARKTGRVSSQKISDVSKSNRLRKNYLIAPFKKKSSDIIKFTNEFFNYAFGRSQQKRLTNLLQAIVRNPILRNDYGPNSLTTIRIKGFDRYMFDTGQLFSAIKARVKRV